MVIPINVVRLAVLAEWVQCLNDVTLTEASHKYRVVCGFLGMPMETDGLRFNPRLPTAWTRLKTIIYYPDQTITLKATKDALYLTCWAIRMKPINIHGGEKAYPSHDTLTI